MESLFQPPGPLRIDVPNLHDEWEFWHEKFRLFLSASGADKKSKEQQLSVFLYCIGDDARRVYHALSFDNADDRKDLSKVLEKFTAYCQPKRNPVYERYVFWHHEYAPGESIDSFVSALRARAKSCNFGDQEDWNILDRIVGTYAVGNRQLQEQLLREADLTLQKAMDICRAKELSKRQASEMSGDRLSSSVDVVYTERRRINQRSKKSTPSFKVDPSTCGCASCGKVHRGNYCPATGKTCAKCGSRGHFAVVCKSAETPAWKSSNRKSLHVVEHQTSDEDSEPDAYVGFISIDACDVSSERSWHRDFKINGTSVSCKLDTGAEGNVMSKSVYKSLQRCPKLSPTSTVLTAYGNSRIEPLGKVAVELQTKKACVNADFYVVDRDAPTIIGLPTCKALDVVRIVDNVHAHTTSARILDEYSDVFKGIGKMPGEHHIVTDPSVPPVVHAPRKVPIALLPKLRVALDDMERDGIIAKCDEPTDWVSSLLIVEKKNGSLRLCLDPRDLNKAIKREHFVIPTCEDVTARLHGKRVFSLIDMTNGFWQVCLDDESSRLCTFNTPFGRYRMRRLPFGISSAPEVFQKRNMQVFGDIDGVHIIFDDLIIAASDDNEHDQILGKVLERARENGVRFNKSKVQLRLPEVKYLGHLLSANGVRPDPDKVIAIRDMPTPGDRKELLRFLGMTTYLSKFIPGYSTITDPLRMLLKKDVPWQWHPEHDSAVRKLKEQVEKAPTLAYFNPNRPVVIQTDASSTGIGSCLLQDERPIAFASRSLTDAETRYAQIEKELLAIVYACEKFSHYIYGHQTTVHSDHKPLEAIWRKQINATSPRLQRMLLRLLKFQLRIEYLPGSKMCIADALSRACLPTTDNDRVLSEEMDIMVHVVLSSCPVSSATIPEFRQETSKDSELSMLLRFVREGFPNDKRYLSSEMKQYAQLNGDIYELEGILFFDGRLIVPLSMRSSMLSLVHEGHFGIDKTKHLARKSIYWPGMNTEIEKLVSKCAVCNKFKRAQQKEPLMPHPVPSRPWQKVGVDIFTWNKRDYLLVVDYFSRFPEVSLLVDKTAQSVVTELKSLFSRHGIPEELVADNMPFNSQRMHRFAESWNFTIITSSTRYPQSNGMAERCIQTIKKLLNKAKEAGTDPYIAMLHYRNTPLSDLDVSPAQLLFSRELRSKLPVQESTLQPRVVEREREMRDRQKRQKYHFDGNAKPLPPLLDSDVVRLRHNNEWTQAIVRQTDVAPRSYVVETQDGSVLRRNRRHLIRTQEDKPIIMPQSDDVNCTPPTADQRLHEPSTTSEVSAAPPLRRSTRSTKLPAHFKDFVMG